MIESTEKFEEEERSKLKNEGANVATRRSGSLPRSMKIFATNNAEEKSQTSGSSRSNIGNTDKKHANVDNDNDVKTTDNDDDDDDDDDAVVIEDKNRSRIAPSNVKALTTESPPSQKSSCILSGIESRKSLNTRRSRVKSPYKSPSKILRGLKSLSKSADL